MGPLFLEAGRIFAVLGCVAAVVGGIASVSAIVSAWQHITTELLCKPLYWVYFFVINGALCVVFHRVIGAEIRSAPLTTVTGLPEEMNPPRG